MRVIAGSPGPVGSAGLAGVKGDTGDVRIGLFGVSFYKRNYKTLFI